MANVKLLYGEVEKVCRRRGTLLGELKVRCQDSFLDLAFLLHSVRSADLERDPIGRHNPMTWTKIELIRQCLLSQKVRMCSMLPVRK